MAEIKRSTVVAVFPSLGEADAAIQDLLRAGFGKGSIGFLMRENEDIKNQQQADATGRAAVVRSVEGGLGGGVLAGLLGSLAALTIPGVGPVLSVGLFAAAGGAIAGSFTGLLSTMDLSDEEIRWYEGELATGRPVVAVGADGRYSEALAILQSHGGYDMTRKRERESTAEV